MTPNLARLAVLAALLMALAACEEGFKLPGQPKGTATAADDEGTAGQNTTRLVERDIEAPDVFQITEAGLWDGRPSLGGVWVAHPDVKDPERVIIRNEANQKFVIGALFRRERDNPGPRVQVSSDAAETLGMLAGQPAKLNVTALRREEIEELPAAESVAAIETPEQIASLSLDQPPGAAPASAAAIGAAATAASATEPLKSAATPAKPASAKATPTRKSTSSIKDAYIQIGIFSVEGNANDTATALRGAGMIPAVRKQTAKGKTFYRVVVGPANTTAERAALLKKVKALGFADAYFTSN